MLWLFACAQPEVAPRDLDAVLHAALLDFTRAETTALGLDAAELRDNGIEEAALPLDGTLTDISAEEVAELGVTRDFDWSTVRGMYSATQLTCSPEDMEQILYAANQDVLYPDNYTAYDRDYTSNVQDFISGATDHLTWDTHYGVDLSVLGTYTASVWSGEHRVDDPDGPYLFSQTVMPEAAVTSPESLVFPADFQIEVLYPHDGGMVHVFGMWRRIEFGESLTTDDDATVRIILDQLHKFDEDTSAICDEGRVGDVSTADSAGD